MMNFSPKSARRAGVLLLMPVLMLAGPSCSDLSEQPHDALTTENAFHTDPEILAGVAGVYATLRSTEWVGYMTMQELTTDMSIVPTRGSDWFDNGQWLDLHRQTFTANSAGTLAFLNGSWNDTFGSIAKANLMIDVITKANSGTKGDSTLAELRTLRAWDYYMLMDMFGGVPLVTSTELKQYARASRSEIFDFIESELRASRDNLPDEWPAEFRGRVTKGAANAILASLYLNAGVFKGTASANSYNSCSGIAVTGGDACAAAIAAADAVLNSSTYSLNADWFQNFAQDNKSSPENIFVIVHSMDKDIGGNWPMRTLHYNQLQLGGGPWNGFATTAETFNKFPTTDERRGMWLFGQAYSFDTGLPANDRTNKPLVFTTTIADATTATEAEGVRFNKFPPDPKALTGSGQNNDFTIFRLAEMYLIKAEAENEMDQLALAQADLDVIHNRHDPTNPVVAASKAAMRDAIINERVLEFAAEGKRRSDMIRQGTFLSWTEASLNGVSSTPRDAHLLLFPVPSPQIASNPQLTQNAGY